MFDMKKKHTFMYSLLLSATSIALFSLGIFYCRPESRLLESLYLIFEMFFAQLAVGSFGCCVIHLVVVKMRKLRWDLPTLLDYLTACVYSLYSLELYILCSVSFVKELIMKWNQIDKFVPLNKIQSNSDEHMKVKTEKTYLMVLKNENITLDSTLMCYK